MRWTRAELEEWLGREALDAEAQPIGKIAGTFVGTETGAPRWLALDTGAHAGDLTPVPVVGAEPTGRAIRFPHLTATIAAAPHQPRGVVLTREQDTQLERFYGLHQDGARREPRPPGGGPGADPAVIEALRAAHALEREAYGRLKGMLAALDDAELCHDAARHLTETQGHAAAISGRLEQLASATSSWRDVLGLVRAAPALSGDTAELLRSALAFERRECSVYGELAATARAAGDAATAAIAERIRADEEAMAETLASSLRRMGVSP